MSWPTPAAVLQAPSKAAAPDSRNKLRTKIAKVLRIGSSIGFNCVLRNVGRAKEKRQDRKLLTPTFHCCVSYLYREDHGQETVVMFEDRALSSFGRCHVSGSHRSPRWSRQRHRDSSARSRSNLSRRSTVSKARSSCGIKGRPISGRPIAGRQQGQRLEMRNCGDSAKPRRS
jgi:hypothetical protein